MSGGRALTRQGKNVVIQDRSKSNDQIFIFDSKSQTIAPKVNNKLSLDIVDWGKNRNLQFVNTEHIWSQKFVLRGERIVNERGLVLDVAGGQDRNGQNVNVWKPNNGLNQKWKVDYV